MEKIIAEALRLAEKAALGGEVPIAAIIFEPKSFKIIASSHNMVETLSDPTAHAEIQTIKSACGKLQNKYLKNLSMFVTLEPCAMCMQAICFTQLQSLYFGAYDYKKGALSAFSGITTSRMNNFVPQIFGGFKEQECSELITNFFKSLRND